MLTISSSTTLGLKLTTKSQSPVSVTGSGTISVASGAAVYAPSTVAAVTLTNQGLLAGGGYGIVFAKGGKVSNQSTGVISGGSAGVSIAGTPGSVINAGTVLGTGTSGDGIVLTGGGSVANGVGSYAALIQGVAAGVLASGKPATVTNAGSIVATSGIGVVEAAGGSVSNGASNSAACIVGVTAGVSVGGTGRIWNAGTITASSGIGVYQNGSGTVSNLGSVGGGSDGVRMRAIGATKPGTLTNDGTITGVTNGADLFVAAQLTNGSATDSSALIAGGRYGVTVAGRATVVNYGTISGAAGAAAALIGSGSLGNFGIITSASGTGIYRAGTATVVNGSSAFIGATIAGGYDGVRLLPSTSAGSGTGTGNPPSTNTVRATLMNWGTITGGTAAVSLVGGGSVTNGAAGDVKAAITGGIDGVAILGLGTVVNDGRIVGTAPEMPGLVFPPPAIPQPTHLIPCGSYGVNLETGGTLINDAGGYIGAQFIGVQAHGGAAHIQNDGTIAGGVVGVYTWRAGTLVNGSASDTLALISGAQLGTWNTYPGEVIHNYATITSSGGSGVDLASGGAPAAAGRLSNGSASDTAATIAGALNGVTTVNGASVSNFGTIVGRTGVGAYVTAGGQLVNGSATDTVATISGATFGAVVRGIFGYGTGTAVVVNVLTNDAGIIGAAVGAAVLNGGTMVNALGASIGGGTGVGALMSGGTSVLRNSGTITSAVAAGVSLNAPATLSNGAAATIQGALGIAASGAPATVTNYGLITGVAGAGVALYAGGSLGNGGTQGVQSAVIAGASAGVLAAGAAGNAASVINAGDILATASGGIGAYLKIAAHVTNGSVSDTIADIMGGKAGICMLQNGAVANYGTVTSTAGGGIYFVNGGTVINGSAADGAALVRGATNAISAAGVATVINDASIASGPNGFGVVFSGSGKVVNGAPGLSGATIAGGARGIQVLGSLASVVNYGTVSASKGIAIYAKSGGTIINAAAALAMGVSYGIAVQGAASISNNGAVLASGRTGDGILLSVGGSLTNGAGNPAATISGTFAGVRENAASLAGACQLANFGTITGGVGVDFSTGAVVGIVANQGAILGTTGAGIYLAGGTVTNGVAGTVAGVARGIAVLRGPGAVYNSGTISGGIGVDFSAASGGGTLVDAGAIVGSLGTSVLFGTGGKLVIDPGATFVGTVNGGGGSAVELAAGPVGAPSGDIGGFGSAIVGFTSVAVDTGATWTLAGTNSIGTLTENGTLQVASGASLDVTGGVDPASAGGVLALDAGATLQMASMTGAGTAIQFLGAGALLTVDAAAVFGQTGGQMGGQGGSHYSGPLLQDFGSGAGIDLADVAFAGATFGYDPDSGLLDIYSSAGTTVATLGFDTASLGGGSFQMADDGAGHVLLTHG